MRVRGEGRVGIGEHDDVAGREGDRRVEGVGLSDPLQVEDRDPLAGDGAGTLDRRVVGAVRGDDDLEPVGRVVEGGEVLQTGPIEAASLRAASTTDTVGSMSAARTGRGRRIARARMSSGAPT